MGKNAASALSTQEISHTKLYRIEIVHPGYAYLWTNDSVGLFLITNMSPEDINRRDKAEGIVFFKDYKRVWSWAKRVAALTTDAVPGRLGNEV